MEVWSFQEGVMVSWRCVCEMETAKSMQSSQYLKTWFGIQYDVRVGWVLAGVSLVLPGARIVT